MTPQCQNINDVKSISLFCHQVASSMCYTWWRMASQLTCTKNINHEVLTPSISMRLMTLCSVESTWVKYLSTNITLGKYENMNNYPYDCVPKNYYWYHFLLSTKVINGDTWNNISIVSHGNNYYTWFCVLFKYYPNPEKIWIQNRINL